MEGGHSPSPNNDRQPLVTSAQQQPEHSPAAATAAAEHPDRDTQHQPASPISPYYPGAPYGGPFSGLPQDTQQQQHEADIADHHVQQAHQGFPAQETHESASVQEARALDWIVPIQNGGPPERRRSVEERLRATLETAKVEQLKYAKRAKLAGMAVNGAMFAQIIVNALVTGLSAAPSSRSAQIGVSAMGAIGTILASFLVRVRGTREPERSVTHSQNLEKFIRELESFILDEGLSTDRKWDSNVKAFREEFDNLQSAVHQSENGQPMTTGPPSNMGELKSKV